MTNYSMNEYSCGAELEFSNCLRDTILPCGASWNKKDNSIINTTGIANDPTGVLYPFGGEINTKPTSTWQEQSKNIEQIIKSLNPSPVVNYRVSLHIHVRVPGLMHDLETCKSLFRYIRKHQHSVYDLFQSVPKPIKGTMPQEEFIGAMEHYKRRLKSHRSVVPESRALEMLAATSTKEFFERHVPLSKNGRMWISPRAGINLRQMWEGTETIEFRHFPSTLNMTEIESCLRWCYSFLDVALNHDETTPSEIFENDGKFQFPKFLPYDHVLEQCYQLTNTERNNRRLIEKRIENARKHCRIEDMSTPASEVLPYLREIE